MIDRISECVNRYVLDTENALLNYETGLAYFDANQNASAITYFLRAAERTNDIDLAYECLLLMAIGFKRQGKRDQSVECTVLRAISIAPHRPEAHFIISEYYIQKEKHTNAYMHAQIALLNEKPHKNLKRDVGYPGKYGLLFNKAVAGWWWGQHEEAIDLFHKLHREHWNEMSDEFKNGVMSNFSRLNISIPIYQKIETPKKIQSKNIVDVFPYFNEKELMELRINTLKDYVDYFVIIEANQTHSGKPKEFTAMTELQQMKNIPMEKILVLNVDYGENIFVDEIDKINSTLSNSSKEVHAWSRERVQRDSIISIVDSFNDDTAFILSDCDEIINPENIEYVVRMAKLNPNSVIKIPLTLLEGRADSQVCDENGNAVPWTEGMMICLKHHLKNSTPTKIKSEKLTPYNIVYITENNQIVTDLGWHFTWMGDEQRKKIKSESFIHYANLNVVNNVSSESLKKLGIDSKYRYGSKQYPKSKLPKEIFMLPLVEKFLFNGEVNA